MLDLPPVPKLWTPPKPAIIRAAEIPKRAEFYADIRKAKHQGIGLIPVFCPAAAAAVGAYPVLESHAEYQSSSRLSSHPITLPSGITDGDALVLAVSGEATAGGRTMTVPAGWLPWYNQVGDGDLRVVALLVKRANGSEGATVTATFSDNVSLSTVALRISGVPDFVMPPEDGGITVPAIELSSSPFHSNTTTCNPPSYTVSMSDGTDHIKWLAVAHYKAGSDVSAGPTGYTKIASATGTAACTTCVAYLDVITATQDPSTFTLPSSCRAVGSTIAVHGT